MTLARELGEELAVRGIGLVYGGARVGMMGAVAGGTLDRGGEVIGVIPRFLEAKEIAHVGVTQLVLVDSMHERKTRMHELSDGAITLPGGFGTLDEFFELLTWAQLALHRKPVALLNYKGFYDGLLRQIETMVETGLLKPSYRELMLVGESIPELLATMERHV